MLRGEIAGPRSDRVVGVLFDRHWERVLQYAGICVADQDAGTRMAMAAFARLIDEVKASDGRFFAWRPQLLLAILKTAAEWAQTDDRVGYVNAQLRAWLDGEPDPARLLGPDQAAALYDAFVALPESDQRLLWHLDVEAEASQEWQGGAQRQLAQARNRLHERYVQALRVRGVDGVCLQYGSLLASSPYGNPNGSPQLGRHFLECAQCRTSAGGLADPGWLRLALVNAILPWGAAQYLQAGVQALLSRVDEDVGAPQVTNSMPVLTPSSSLLPAPPPGQSGTARHAGTQGPTQRHAATHSTARRPARGRSLAGPQAAGVALVALLATGAYAIQQNGGGVTAGAPAPQATSGAVVQVALRNSATGECLDVRDGVTAPGNAVVTASCATALTQKWNRAPDGTFHSAADPNLCLAAPEASDGQSLTISACNTTPVSGAQFDLTPPGALVLRGAANGAVSAVVAPGPDSVVIKALDGSPAQTWGVVGAQSPGPT
ncbi:RICIN domain-containing protein [Streptomyces sp. NPDC005728]|uniref:RICIN domain-containing protein n=1 Tax=Streptomyces sp. NPDC005728 TaxID=3157054 RepID=UPI0033FE8FD8